MADKIRYIKNIPGGRGDLPFSRAVVANGFVWVSGVGGASQTSGAGGGTIEEQTRGTIENLRKILAVAGRAIASQIVASILSSVSRSCYRRFVPSSSACGNWRPKSTFRSHA